MRLKLAVLAGMALSLAVALPAKADKLDDIIASGHSKAT